MKQGDRARISRLLQKAADCLYVNERDRITIGYNDASDEGDVWFRHDAWSAALTRIEFDSEVSMDCINFDLMPECQDMTWEEIALPVVKALFEDELARQTRREATATALGLVQGRRLGDLPFSRLLIDRSMRRLLDEAGVDVRGAAAHLSASPNPSSLDNCFAMIQNDPCERSVLVQDRSVGRPVLSTWFAIGAASFTGEALEIGDAIPDTVAAAARGRRLGDLVATGLAWLDARSVREAVTNDRRSPYSPGLGTYARTRFVLDPDLVELGESA